MKIKILFILHLPPPIHGSSVVGNYIKNSKIINNSFDCSYINLGTSKRIEEIGKFRFHKIFGYIRVLWKLIYQLLYHKPRLVYLTLTAFGPAFYRDSVITFIIKLFGVKIVYHFHNKGVIIRQDYFFDNILYRFVFNNSEVILLSKYLYSDIRKYISLDRVHFCPNGIPDLFENTVNPKKNDNIQLLFLSNLIQSKGVYVLLKACHILKLRKLAFHCNFVGAVGDISKEDFERKVMELGLNEFVTYCGEKYGNDKSRIFKSSDIFVFPTHYIYETFGIVIIEAMMNKLPVVSTFEGAIPEIVKNKKTGFLVSQMDVVKLTNRLELLINSPKLRLKMGSMGRNRYLRNYTIDIFENTLQNILNKIIIQRRL